VDREGGIISQTYHQLGQAEQLVKLLVGARPDPVAPSLRRWALMGSFLGPPGELQALAMHQPPKLKEQRI
jgi:hypothetical protein